MSWRELLIDRDSLIASAYEFWSTIFFSHLLQSLRILGKSHVSKSDHRSLRGTDHAPEPFCIQGVRMLYVGVAIRDLLYLLFSSLLRSQFRHKFAIVGMPVIVTAAIAVGV